MSNLKEQLKNTKSLKDAINVFNKESDAFYQNISNSTYSDVSKHIDNLMMFIVNAKEEGKIEIGLNATFQSKGTHSYYNINEDIKLEMAQDIYKYAEEKLKEKPIELENFKNAMLSTMSEINQNDSEKQYLDTLMSDSSFTQRHAKKKKNKVIPSTNNDEINSQISPNVKGTIEKLRTNGSDSTKENSPKNK